jgi:hypothetical protein
MSGEAPIFGTPPDPMPRVPAILGILLSLAVLGEGIHRWNKSRTASTWPTVTGHVLSNALRAVSASQEPPHIASVQYHLELVYTYEVGGRRYTNDRLRFIPEPLSQMAAAQRARRYPVGSALPIRYNRRQPAESVLDPGGEWDGLAMAAAGFVGLIGSVHQLRQRCSGSPRAPDSEDA